ncbi:MAG: hypothetical protein HY843_00255 [Bdellovibrio sp.]|nr:hypothetical protein [Bdellovibrio sp.]
MSYRFIKQNMAPFVKGIKANCFSGIVIFILSCFAYDLHSQENQSVGQKTDQNASEDKEKLSDSTEKLPDSTEKLPDITAKTYQSKIIRKSKSSRIYLLEIATDNMPQVGRILLFKKNAEPVKAFRVLKIYFEKDQFAAKAVRKYPNYLQLNTNETYFTVEKISDVIPPEPTAADLEDLKELEAPEMPKEPPPEEVQEISPIEKDKIKEIETLPAPEEEPSLSEDEDLWLSLTAEEVFPLDLNRFGLSAELGFLRAVNPDSIVYYFSGGGFRFNLKLFQIVFIKRPLLQDSLTLEAAAFLVRIQNLGGGLNAYTLVPTIGDLRYTIHIGEGFNVFFYGGISKGFVISTAQGDLDVIKSFSVFQPAAGGGIIFRVGPNWEVRVNLGYDMVGGGILLRF